MCFGVKENLLMRLSLAQLKGCYRLINRQLGRKAGLFHFDCLIEFHSKAFEPTGSTFFVAEMDFTGELSHR
jgi:hypothetical protein